MGRWIDLRAALLRYGGALLVAGAIFGLRVVFSPILPHQAPFVTFLLGVTFNGWLFGAGSSYLTLAIFDLLANYFVSSPHHIWQVVEIGQRVSFLLFNAEGVGICLILANLDTTRRKLEQALHEAQVQGDQMASLRAEAEQASRAKDQFLGTVSHELRNPLNAIMLTIPLLRNEIASLERAESGVRTIEIASASLGKMIDDLLDSTRIATGRLRLELKPIDLVESVKQAVDMMRPAAAAKGLALIGSNGIDSAWVHGDEARLRQVVCDLIENAIKFTKAGRVTVNLTANCDNVILSVEDTGEGIGPEVLPHIFDPFAQAHQTSGRKSGLGLGLFIVRNVVELHGGSIGATSQGQDHGAVFRVVLPKTAAASPDS